ncbi:tRNA adenosine(34) deaminase TadA [Xylocopilactobacillus apicola]|uniref:tRNA-specific adenosine deaminase n=1 Tax=Xylocopilactobacillus apicola TaxID=2932184 RepID=A0AAU9CYA9_9LACO|nr:tRNA adenosine(34) deaminase TadA [Xylocopilactobacillus apicola]BDR59009.1 tRNA-specific adenosine deaminase [Xylocopilactobacillus apicola]
MRKALEQAEIARSQAEVPIGAVVVLNGKVIGRGYNQREINENALHHAEMIAISNACKKIGYWRLIDCELFVTIEPCPMCAGALINSRIKRVVFGALDPKAGAVVSLERILDNPKFNHHVTYEGNVLETECQEIMKKFFREIRLRQKNAKNSL